MWPQSSVLSTTQEPDATQQCAADHRELPHDDFDLVVPLRKHGQHLAFDFLAVHLHRSHALGDTLGVADSDVIHGTAELAADLEALPGLGNARIDQQTVERGAGAVGKTGNQTPRRKKFDFVRKNAPFFANSLLELNFS